MDILVIFTLDTVDISLSAIWFLPISRENIATFFPYLIAAFSAIFKANDVLPIAGLAANIISSQGLNHPAATSNPSYQLLVFNSNIFSGFSANSKYVSYLPLNISLICTIESDIWY